MHIIVVSSYSRVIDIKLSLSYACFNFMQFSLKVVATSENREVFSLYRGSNLLVDCVVAHSYKNDRVSRLSKAGNVQHCLKEASSRGRVVQNHNSRCCLQVSRFGTNPKTGNKDFDV